MSRQRKAGITAGILGAISVTMSVLTITTFSSIALGVGGIAVGVLAILVGISAVRTES